MSGILERLRSLIKPVAKIREQVIEEVHPQQAIISALELMLKEVHVSSITQSVVSRMVLVRVYHPSIFELVNSVYLTTPDARDNKLYAVSLGRYFVGNISPEESLQRLVNGVKETKSLSGRIRHDINTIIEVLRENQ